MMVMVIAGFGFLILIPLIYWANNPDLSQMQVFIATWKTSLIGVALLLIGCLLKGVKK